MPQKAGDGNTTQGTTRFTTRSISVDARYIIWTLDLLDGGDHLIKEMGLQPRL